jgi:hypothetical protein
MVPPARGHTGTLSDLNESPASAARTYPEPDVMVAETGGHRNSPSNYVRFSPAFLSRTPDGAGTVHDRRQ